MSVMKSVHRTNGQLMKSAAARPVLYVPPGCGQRPLPSRVDAGEAYKDGPSSRDHAARSVQCNSR